MGALVQHLNQIHEPILHAHGPRLNILASFAARQTKRPWTTTIHSNPQLDFLGSRLKTRVYPALHLWRLKRASGIFTVNRYFEQLLPKRPIWFVPNAIETPKLASSVAQARQQIREQLGLSTDTKLIGIAARFDPVKNIPVLIRALHQLPDIHLAIAGDGAQRVEIERLVAALNLRDRVHFLGFIANVGEFYAGLDVHVLPSQSEGMPSSLLEAGALSVPNVGSDIPGIRQLIEDGKTGLLAPVGDADGLATAVQRVVNDANLKDTLVRHFQAMVLPQYQPSRMVEAYLTGYAQLK